MSSALADHAWDLVLSDHSMPRFDAMAALAIYRESHLDVPFIIVSGAIDAESAVNAMRAGAHDYVLKQNLHRLLPSVERELKDAESRRLHRETEAALMRSEERFRMVFEESPVGIALALSDNRFVRVNAALCRMLGFHENDLVNKTFQDVTHPDDLPDDARKMVDLWAGRSAVYEQEKRYVRKDGGIVWASTVVSLIRNHEGSPLYAIAMIEDITVRKRVEDDLRKAVDRLEELDHYRQEFVSNVSHEMKTPLASIMFAARNLLSGVSAPLAKETAQYVKLIDGEARRLLNTVNDILDLRQLESRAFRLTTVRMPIARLVVKRCEAMRALTDEKRLELVVAADRKAGFVDCDPERMERVVTNILSNAVKFTPSGGQVQVGVHRDKECSDRILVAVEDTGVGIPSEALPRITERYFRAGNHPSGTGLGLAISKEIVRLHGGDLMLMSPPPDKEKGTLVCVRLPAAKPTMVLLVGEDTSLRRTVEHQLLGYGYGVAIADGDGMAPATAERPACVVVDVTEGCEAAFVVKCNQALRDVPAVAVSGNILNEDAQRVIRELEMRLILKPRAADAVVDGIQEEVGAKAVFDRGAKTPGTERTA
jgi:PAS domain S-box-containing protein